MRCSPAVLLSIAIALVLRTFPAATATQLVAPKNFQCFRGGFGEDSSVNNDLEGVNEDVPPENVDHDDTEASGEDSDNTEIEVDANKEIEETVLGIEVAAASPVSNQYDSSDNSDVTAALDTLESESHDSDQDQDIGPKIEYKNAAGVQYMVTSKMRKSLIDLDYIDEEVNEIEPQIAAVVIEKKQRRPKSGMPAAWKRGYVASTSKASAAKDAIAKLAKKVKPHLPIIAATTLGGVALYTQRGLFLKVGSMILSKIPGVSRKRKTDTQKKAISGTQSVAPTKPTLVLTKSASVPTKSASEYSTTSLKKTPKYQNLIPVKKDPKERTEPAYRKFLGSSTNVRKKGQYKKNIRKSQANQAKAQAAANQ